LSLDVKPDIERDGYWHQEMGRVPALEDDAFSVQEVTFGGRSIAREVVETIILTLLIFVGVRLLVQNFVVEGSSMEPSLHNGQNLLVNKLAYAQWDTEFFARLNPLQDGPAPASSMAYAFGGPQRGDIVIFPAPGDTRDFIKRVIGLAGEQVEIRNNDGVYINGQKLTEPYVMATPNYDWPAAGQTQTIPDGKIFVMGDNRRESDDSHIFGPIAINTVIGRAWFDYWPLDHAGPLPHPTYQAP
jgi:signal peptidase I